MPNAPLSSVKHIVVLMRENRSFAHMLESIPAKGALPSQRRHKIESAHLKSIRGWVVRGRCLPDETRLHPQVLEDRATRKP
jgi:phospholipase C